MFESYSRFNVIGFFFCNTTKKNPNTCIKCVYINSDTIESTQPLMKTCTSAFNYEFEMGFKQL